MISLKSLHGRESPDCSKPCWSKHSTHSSKLKQGYLVSENRGRPVAESYVNLNSSNSVLLCNKMLQLLRLASQCLLILCRVAVPGRNRTLFHCVFQSCYCIQRAVSAELPLEARLLRIIVCVCTMWLCSLAAYILYMKPFYFK